jgi:hypothetical protein
MCSFNVTTNELQRIYLRGVQEQWPTSVSGH